MVERTYGELVLEHFDEGEAYSKRAILGTLAEVYGSHRIEAGVVARVHFLRATKWGLPLDAVVEEAPATRLFIDENPFGGYIVNERFPASN